MIGNLHYMSLFQKEVELPYLNFKANTASTIGIQWHPSYSGDVPQNTLYYSLNNGTSWVSYTPRQTAAMISLNPGQRICWKCNVKQSYGSSSNDRYYRFIMTGSLQGAGNIMSLIDGAGETLNIPYSYCFKELFSGCSSLTTAPELPATNAPSGCYKSMFNSCTSLTTAPTILPAMSVQSDCYAYMFNGCTSLINAPSLPATSVQSRCYESMFSGCRSLTVLPRLPATYLYSYCYQSMFSYCTSIKLSTTLTGEYQTSYGIHATPGTGSFSGMFSNTGGTWTGTPAYNTTYYTSNTVV